MGDEIIDPEWERYAKKYPNFPGVQKCVELLGSSFLRGTRVDFVVTMIENHAHDHGDELIDAYWAQSDERLRAIITNVISNEPIKNTEDFFWNVLNSQHEESWSSAFHGLKQLNNDQASEANSVTNTINHNRSQYTQSPKTNPRILKVWAMASV